MACAAMSGCVQPKCSDYHDPTCWSPPAPATDAAALDAGDADATDAFADAADDSSSKDGGVNSEDATPDGADP
jgi:hypothetical protein